MSVATLTSKGQITLPRDIRTKLHLEKGDKVSFRFDEPTGMATLCPMNKRVDEVFGMLKNTRPNKPVTVEEMDRAIDEKLKRDFLR